MDADRGRNAERLIVFTDAVVAIAITLLALPLIDLGAEAEGRPFGDLLAASGPQFLGFAISFFVIARLWWGHHRIFAHVISWTRAMVVLDVFWLFTIVLLPVATSLTTAYRPDRNPGAVATYLGLMAVSSALLTAIAVIVQRHPELTEGHDDAAAARTAGSVETTAGFLLALAIGVLFPVVNYFALFVLALTGQVGRLVSRRRRRGASR